MNLVLLIMVSLEVEQVLDRVVSRGFGKILVRGVNLFFDSQDKCFLQ